MNLPKKIYLSRIEIQEAKFKTPKGKIIVLNKKKPSMVSDDPQLLDFMSKQKGIAIGDLNDREFRSYMTKRAMELPSASNHDMTLEEALEYKWNEDAEKKVVEKLKKLGYIVYLKNSTAPKKQLKKKRG